MFPSGFSTTCRPMLHPCRGAKHVSFHPVNLDPPAAVPVAVREVMRMALSDGRAPSHGLRPDKRSGFCSLVPTCQLSSQQQLNTNALKGLTTLVPVILLELRTSTYQSRPKRRSTAGSSINVAIGSQASKTGISHVRVETSYIDVRMEL